MDFLLFILINIISYALYLMVPATPIYFISWTHNKNSAVSLCVVVYYSETRQRLNIAVHFIFWSPNLPLKFRKYFI